MDLCPNTLHVKPRWGGQGLALEKMSLCRCWSLLCGVTEQTRAQAPWLHGSFKSSLVLCVCVCVCAAGCPGGSDSKESACNAGDSGSIPGSRRAPGEENGYPLQYFCLENPKDSGAWWATLHGVEKSRTWLNDLKKKKANNSISPQLDWLTPYSFASAVPSPPAAWRRPPLVQVLIPNVPPVNFSLTLLPTLKQKPLGFWMTSFIWLPPTAGVTGIFWFFPGGTAKLGDWTTLYFLCLQHLAPGLEHRGPSKSVCGCTGSKEGCRQHVCSPQIVMRVGLLLTAAMSSLFRNRPSTPRSDGWDSRLAACGVSSLPWWKALSAPQASVQGPFPMATHFSLSWAQEASRGLGEGTGPCSWQGWGGAPQLLMRGEQGCSITGLNVVGKMKLNYTHVSQELRWFVTAEQPL